VTGTDPVTALSLLSAMGADVVGANCMIGPVEMLPVFERLASTTDHPLSVQPNAGMPQLVEGQTIYPATPEQMANEVENWICAGARLVGGCCGTNLNHYQAISQKIGGRKASQVISDKRPRS
jgi:5-methyltetrahydrofolate--homocysteine methyltransferase